MYNQNLEHHLLHLINNLIKQLHYIPTNQLISTYFIKYVRKHKKCSEDKYLFKIVHNNIFQHSRISQNWICYIDIKIKSKLININLQSIT